MNLLEDLEERVVCGDGAMGTLLLDRGVPPDRCIEELCVSEPDRVLEIHEEYIRAGARLIETNTFGANAVRLGRFGLEDRAAEINHAAASLAVEAACGEEVYVAGSIGPLGITADEARERGIDRSEVFREQATALIEAGAQILFLETFTDFGEMETAVRAIPSSDCAIICSFACKPEGRLQSGMLVSDAFAHVRVLGAKVVGVNCLNGPHAIAQLFEQLPAGDLLAAYPNAGYPRYTDGRYVYPAGPDCFAALARNLATRGVRLIGGCCGTTPRHIAAIAKAIENSQPVGANSCE